MAGPIPVTNFLNQAPDFLRTAREGYQYGQQKQDDATLRGLAPGVVAGDPAAYNQAAALDPAKAGALQGAGDANLRRLKGAINFLDQAKSSGNQVALQAAWKEVAPFIGQVTGKPMPPEYPVESEAAFEQLKARIAMADAGGAGDDLKSLRVGGNGNYWAIRGGQLVDTGTPAPPQNQIIAVQQPDGSVQYQSVNKATANPTATPVTTGAPPMGQPAPQGAPPLGTDVLGQFESLKASFPGAVISSTTRTPEHNREVGGVPNSQHIRGTAADFVVPPQQKQAFAQQARSMGFEAIDEGDHIHLELPPGGQRQAVGPVGGNQIQTPSVLTGAPTPRAPSDQWMNMSADEIAAAGLPPGTFAQRNLKDNSIKVGPASAQPPKANAAQALKKQKAEEAKQDTITTYDDGIQQINALLRSDKFKTLGTAMGDIQANIPYIRSDAKDARAALDTIKSRIVIDTLGKLKALSATGASGFGALSNQEATILQNSMASLDTAQSNEQLRESLTQIMQIMQRTRNRLEGQAVELPDDQPATAADVEDLLNKYAD